MNKPVRFISKQKPCWAASNAGEKEYLRGMVKLPVCITVRYASNKPLKL